MSALNGESQAEGSLLRLWQSGNHREITDFHSVCKNGKRNLFFTRNPKVTKHATPT